MWCTGCKLTGRRWEFNLLPNQFFLIIDPADLARTKLDTINTACRETLSTFHTFVCGINGVCLHVWRCSGLDWWHAQIHPHAQMAFSELNRVSKVFVDHARYSWFTRFLIADAVANKSRSICGDPRRCDPSSLWVDPGKRISIEDQLFERCVSRDRASHTRMFAVCHKVPWNPNLLCVSYSRHFHHYLIFH